MFFPRFRLFFLSLLLIGGLQLSTEDSHPVCASNEQVEEIVTQGTITMEEKQEDLYELFVRKMQRLMSSAISGCSTSIDDRIEGLMKNYTEILYKKVMEKIQNVHTTTLDELQKIKQQMENMSSQVESISSQNENLSLQVESISSQMEKLSTGQTDGQEEQSHVTTPTTGAPYMYTTVSVSSTTAPKTKDSELSTVQHVSLKGTYEYPVGSCKDIPKGSPSGEYWVVNNCNKTPVKVFCDMMRTGCNDTRGWTRIANLDMTNTSHECPSGFKPLTYDTPPYRLCGRGSSSGCVSTKFDAHSINYSRVCGRVIGYQYGDLYAFYYSNRNKLKINSAYVEGVSLTHGNSQTRTHIWTFAAGSDETRSSTTYLYTCPCTRTDIERTNFVPSFVGQDYFCDTANHNMSLTTKFPFYNDPLWDGDGCVSTSSCCCFNTPPWFCKELPEPTTDDIELRLCSYGGGSGRDSPLEIVELYVK